MLRPGFRRLCVQGEAAQEQIILILIQFPPVQRLEDQPEDPPDRGAVGNGMVEIHQQADIGFRHEDVRAPEKLVHHPEGADKGLFLFRELRLGRFGDPDLRDPVRAVSLDQFDRVVEHEHGAEGRKVVRYMIHGFLQRLRINCFPREGAEVGEVGHDQFRGIELVIQVI